MKKIRINELARELEVKPGVIIDLLPELGVQEKKTHSSSVDEEIAIALRDRLIETGVIQPYSQRSNGFSHVESEEPEDGSESLRQSPELPQTTSQRELPVAEVQGRGESPVTETPKATAPATGGTTTPAVPRLPLRPPTRDIRPPAPPAMPLIPATPHAHVQPAQPPTQAAILSEEAGTTVLEQPAVIPAEPASPVPGEPERPAPRFQPLRPPLGGASAHPTTAPAPGGPPVNRTMAVPAKPLPQAPARPSSTAPSLPTPAGPRQPLPPSAPQARMAPGTPARPIVTTSPAPASKQPVSTGSPAIPRPTAAPGAPLPASPKSPQPPTHVVAPGSAPSGTAPGAPIPSRPASPRPPLTPGTPIAPRTAAPRPPLAGQPVARPVVPPRPDMVQRLKQQGAQVRLPASSPVPAAPRPGAPARSPAPGQPIFRPPVRPGQPTMRGPGGPGMPSQPAGLRRPGMRPMHPTALRPESAAPMPVEQQRRHQARPTGRLDARKRKEQEGNLRERVFKRPTVVELPPIDREITIAEGITVKELSEKLGVKANLVIKKLVEKKIFATINQTLDVKLAEELSRDFGASTNQVSYEEESTQDIELAEDPKELVRRAPVVTIMGHVDHGKTSLLDAIRQTNVAGREAGGITQHIGAYYVEKNNRKIVFIDTPGHQAFTRMRARGAKVTDIVVLVVSADDGVMPQTLEAIDHARAANVPILVAINKIDKPDAQPERVKQQLADRGLLAEDWGGDVVMVPVSAKMGQNLDLLLEMILLVADIQDLKANPQRPALGTVLEAKLDKGRGPVATMLVRNGTFRVGDFFICGALFSKVRAMFDDRGNSVREAEPSMPVEVIGLESLPEVGDSFQVVSDTSKAKQIVIYREAKARDAAMAKGARVATLASLNEQFKEGELKDLNLIIKADVGGTAEVLSDTLQQLSNEKVRVRVLRTGVGAITEDDVLLASASDALIVGFNVRPERNAQATAEQQKVDIRLHSIIYELIEEIQLAMTGLLEPVYKEVVQGHAEVRETFRISKVGTVAGCYVADGLVRRDSQVRVLRDGDVVHTGRLEALKRFKNDASEVKNGLECGISLANFNNVQIGDTLEFFTTERIAPQLPVAAH
ncbi:MAG: translation initiation factor IF-2 [Acidobacteriaceae bacterium]|nr:translation initiation factor IF-2 [Acidobacteriaceae bacterium]